MPMLKITFSGGSWDGLTLAFSTGPVPEYVMFPIHRANEHPEAFIMDEEKLETYILDSRGADSKSAWLRDGEDVEWYYILEQNMKETFIPDRK